MSFVFCERLIMEVLLIAGPTFAVIPLSLTKKESRTTATSQRRYPRMATWRVANAHAGGVPRAGGFLGAPRPEKRGAVELRGDRLRNHELDGLFEVGRVLDQLDGDRCQDRDGPGLQRDTIERQILERDALIL